MSSVFVFAAIAFALAGAQTVAIVFASLGIVVAFLATCVEVSQAQADRDG